MGSIRRGWGVCSYNLIFYWHWMKRLQWRRSICSDSHQTGGARCDRCRLCESTRAPLTGISFKILVTLSLGFGRMLVRNDWDADQRRRFYFRWKRGCGCCGHRKSTVWVDSRGRLLSCVSFSPLPVLWDSFFSLTSTSPNPCLERLLFGM